MSYLLDASVASSRQGGPSFSLRHRLLRVIWNVSWLLLASWTPASFYGWRRTLLRVFGARMGRFADVRGSARVWFPPNLVMGDRTLIAAGAICYNMDVITLGDGALVSQGAHLCGGSHDIRDPHFQLIAKPIMIHAGAWIAAEAFVGLGVTIGSNAVLGARSVTFKDIPHCAIAIGNPAKVVGHRPMTEAMEGQAS